MERSEGTTTKADLVEEVARTTELTKKQAEAVVENVFAGIVESLRAGQKIELRGFGSFKLRQRGARVARNPKKSGVKVLVPPKRVPYFKPGKKLKELINLGEDQEEATAGKLTAKDRPQRPLSVLVVPSKPRLN